MMRNILTEILITEDDYIEIDKLNIETKEILVIPSLFRTLFEFLHHVISHLFNFILHSESMN